VRAVVNPCWCFFEDCFGDVGVPFTNGAVHPFDDDIVVLFQEIISQDHESLLRFFFFLFFFVFLFVFFFLFIQQTYIKKRKVLYFVFSNKEKTSK
jgi:hypothetical protein